MKKKKNDPLMPGTAELQAQNIKSLLENKGFQEIFVPLVQEQKDEALISICKANDTETLFKAAGQLKTVEVIQRSIEALVELGERKKNERMQKITQENLKHDR